MRPRKDTRGSTGSHARPCSRGIPRGPGSIRAGARPRTLLIALVGLALLSPAVTPSWSAPPLPPVDRARELALRLRKLDETRRVLYVTAHPDDEDNALMAFLAHGRGIEVELMTLTRGEGGQNAIGPEFQDALAVLRSRELEAMTAFTGHTQTFSCARDFGYSFSVEETFEKWDRATVLKTIVKRIRAFRPDVILCLPPDGAGGGQHHQASARLAIEAFDLAAERTWPELGPPHRARRLLHHVWGGTPPESAVAVPLGGYDPLLGTSYKAVGLAARALHMCQNMAVLSPAVPADTSYWAWVASADSAADPPRPLSSLLEGLAPPSRPPRLEAMAERVRADFRIEDSGAIVDGLIAYLDFVNSKDGPAAPWRNSLRANAARALELALDLEVEARADRRWIAAGDSLAVTITARNAGTRTLRVEAAAVLDGSRATRPVRSAPVAADLPGGARLDRAVMLPIPRHQAPTIDPLLPAAGKPVAWSRAEASIDNGWSSFRLAPRIVIDGRAIELPDRAVEVQAITDVLPSIYHADPQVVPDPSLRPALDRVPMPFVHGDSAHAEVTWWVSSLAGGPVTVSLIVPPGVRVTPAVQRLDTPPGVEKPVRFRVSMSRGAAEAPQTLTGTARLDGVDGTGTESSAGFVRVAYPHIRPGALLVDASATLVPFDCHVPDALRVGYVAGSGDGMPEALAALGLTPRLLADDDLLSGSLDDLGVIITGVRAYRVREALRAAHPRLMKWVEAGGTLIVQYNRDEFNDGAAESPFAPYPGVRGTSRRATDESAPVRVMQPDHPAFHAPNRIGADDWNGWVQERGTYLIDANDSRYTELLSLEDPFPFNAGPQRGALVEAGVGRGRWVYCGLALFRQLPAAVPGGYRILVNLLNLGTLSSTHGPPPR